MLSDSLTVVKTLLVLYASEGLLPPGRNTSWMTVSVGESSFSRVRACCLPLLPISIFFKMLDSLNGVSESK